MRKSIEKIQKVYETSGSYPFLILCDDLESYVTKYKQDYTAYNLFKEYVAASFLKIWELSVPDFSLITIEKEHWISHPYLNPYDLDHTCFGSKYSRDFSEIINFMVQNSKYGKEYFTSKEDILFIALFDIWLSNEDRNANNPNLMYNLSTKKFIPIDHQHIFNSSSRYERIFQIDFYDSILYHPIVEKIFKKEELINQQLLHRIRDRYYICIENCRNQLATIISDSPENWNLNTTDVNNIFERKIFTEDWIRTTFETFINFVQIVVKSY